MKRFVLVAASLLASLGLCRCSGSAQQQFAPTGSLDALARIQPGGQVEPDAYYYVFIVENGSQRIVKYARNCGKPVAGFSTGTKDPEGIAVDTTGKVYVANGADNSVTTYVNQKPSTPVITSGISDPLAVAFSKGKIYVANYASNSITTYAADGSPSKPTITAGINGPQGIFVDSSGKIYVANGSNNTVTTYNANGTQTTPTIQGNLDNPYGIVVSHQPATKGYIYVANKDANTIGIYRPDGSMYYTYTGYDQPEGMATAQGGAMFVTNYGNGTLSVNHGFCHGISGLDGPSGVATLFTK